MKSYKSGASGIVATLAQCSRSEADVLLENCNGEVKTAIIMQLLELSPIAARARLDEFGGHLRQALESGTTQSRSDS